MAALNAQGLLWSLGAHLPRWATELIVRTVPWVVAPMRLQAVEAWAKTVEAATGERVGRRERRTLLEHWLRNALWSLSLARWSRREILGRARPAPGTLDALRTSLMGPGLILVLPHMASWDFAGAWCAQQGISVVSVAERLPAGLYERFTAARAKMGIRVYPMDQPDLLRALSEDLAGGAMVCLLADRDLTGRGVAVPWPETNLRIAVPAGPALLARRTGADLRAVRRAFDGPTMELSVSEPLPQGSTRELCAAMVREFAAAVRSAPTSWLMLRTALQ